MIENNQIIGVKIGALPDGMGIQEEIGNEE